jgi:broad specificity polyphosphatase/5'/3'-nucleotidase SurE
MENPPPLLNINTPPGELGPDIQAEITTLTRMRWRTIYHERESPRGGNYFWITYEAELPPKEGSDAAAVAAGRISVTPLAIMTIDEESVSRLRDSLAR